MKILLHSFHSTLDDMPLDSVTITRTWHIIMSCDKYNINQKSLSSWFKAWWKHESQKHININNYIQFLRELIYPYFIFNNTPAFIAVTRKLVYNYIGHITKQNPTDMLQIHLPPRIIHESIIVLFLNRPLTSFQEQLNAARGRLRNILHKELHGPPPPFPGDVYR